MTKQEFVSEVARKSGLSSDDAERAVDAFLEAIAEFGTDRGMPLGDFSLVERHDRLEGLGRAAQELREEVDDLKRTHREAAGRIDSSRQTLREIANPS